MERQKTQNPRFYGGFEPFCLVMVLAIRRGGGTRTHDLCVPNAALYQLSHTPKASFHCALGQIRTADL